jgi:tetratricopeptide (TPR) repeat protein
MSAVRLVLFFVAGFMSTGVHVSYADEITCGSLAESAFSDGPKDYRHASKAIRDLVERVHFTQDVESLRRGATGERIAKDIDYTLRAFPNHPRALLAMSRLSIKQRRNRPAGARWPIECYFERAIRFRPDDPMPHLIAGLHFAKVGQKDEAVRNLDQADALTIGTPSDANLQYNLGLGYLEVGMHEKSLQHAKRAYELGFPLPGLKNRLVKAGVWKD